MHLFHAKICDPFYDRKTERQHRHCILLAGYHRQYKQVYLEFIKGGNSLMLSWVLHCLVFAAMRYAMGQ